jgi:3-dehydroquinate dehydratase I
VKKRGLSKIAQPKIVGVIASAADLKVALGMDKPPDLFELRLDCLSPILRRLERAVPTLQRPIIITARDPREGGIGNLSPKERANLLARFLARAKYIDVELRNARAFKPILDQARKRKVRRIFSFHAFKSTPAPRVLRARAGLAKKLGADIFKIACRVDSPTHLAQLANFILASRGKIAVSAMGIGRLGAASRLLLTRCGSVLNYGSLDKAHVEGQISIDLLRSALRSLKL